MEMEWNGMKSTPWAATLNDEHESFDDDESSANDESVDANASANASANNPSDDMNEDGDQTNPARNSQKKKNAMTKIARDEQTKSDSKND